MPKISAKKVLRFGVGLALLCVLVMALVAAGNRQQHGLLKGINIERISRSTQLAISQQELMSQLKRSPKLDLGNTPVGKLDLRSIEQRIGTNPWVRNAEVYIDAHNTLQIKVKQRQPVARIFEVTGRSYYLDSACKLLPIPQSAPYPVPVFTNVPLLNGDTMRRNLVLKQIAAIGAVILRDTFWNAQITQIDVADNNEMTAYTLAGEQKILLGTGKNIEQQLKNLLLFFKKVNTKIGWEHYTKLDTRFAGQIVASPALGYIPPIVKDTTVQLPDNDEAVHQPAQGNAPILSNAPLTTTPRMAPKPRTRVSTPKPSKPIKNASSANSAAAKPNAALARTPNTLPKKTPAPDKTGPKRTEQKAKYEMSSSPKK